MGYPKNVKIKNIKITFQLNQPSKENLNSVTKATSERPMYTTFYDRPCRNAMHTFLSDNDIQNDIYDRMIQRLFKKEFYLFHLLGSIQNKICFMRLSGLHRPNWQLFMTCINLA